MKSQPLDRRQASKSIEASRLFGETAPKLEMESDESSDECLRLQPMAVGVPFDKCGMNKTDRRGNSVAICGRE